MLIERVEQRVLGALQVLERATRTPVTRPLELRSAHAAVVRNRAGLYVITAADGLEAHVESFLTPPPAPAPGSLSYRFSLRDPMGHHLPRQLVVRLPRDPDPGHLGNDDSLFTPQPVLMYPASAAPLSHNWSSVRLSVSQGAAPGGTRPVRGALARIVDKADDRVLGSGISDPRGEALIIVPGVPVTKFADEGDAGHGHGPPPVVVNTLPVRLELSLTASDWPVDPDVLEQQHRGHIRATRDLELRTGRMQRVVIHLT